MADYVDKKTDMRKFTAFQAGEGALFKITKNAAPVLYELAKQYPEAVGEALFMLGGHVRKRMKKTIAEGGPTARKWLELSDIQRHRRLDRLKAGELPRRAHIDPKSKTINNLFSRAKDKPSSFGIFGKAGQAIAFRNHKGKNLVEIGALSPSAARFMEAVQGGGRGSKGAFQFIGRQHVTPAIRRMFWAAGYPLSKHTTVIGQEQRPLIPPLFKEISPELESYLARRTAQILAKKGIELV